MQKGAAGRAEAPAARAAPLAQQLFVWSRTGFAVLAALCERPKFCLVLARKVLAHGHAAASKPNASKSSLNQRATAAQLAAV